MLQTSKKNGDKRKKFCYDSIFMQETKAKSSFLATFKYQISTNFFGLGFF
jgi:hypothetical protein